MKTAVAMRPTTRSGSANELLDNLTAIIAQRIRRAIMAWLVFPTTPRGNLIRPYASVNLATNAVGSIMELDIRWKLPTLLTLENSKSHRQSVVIRATLMATPTLSLARPQDGP